MIENSLGVKITPDGRLTREGAAAYLGITSKTLENWYVRKEGPRCFKIGGRCFYRITDIDAYIEEQYRRSFDSADQPPVNL